MSNIIKGSQKERNWIPFWYSELEVILAWFWKFYYIFYV
jgi:hypothetical protein